jgi:hypothetical protein
MTDYTKHIDSHHYPLSIERFGTKSVTFAAEKGETVEISIREGVRFNVEVFDPEGELIWQELNVTSSHYRAKTLKSGVYKIEVKNLSAETISIPMYILRTLRTTIRPLEPAGQWLSLISFPIIGFGIWMIMAEPRAKAKRTATDRYAK